MVLAHWGLGWFLVAFLGQIIYRLLTLAHTFPYPNCLNNSVGVCSYPACFEVVRWASGSESHYDDHGANFAAGTFRDEYVFGFFLYSQW